jgi:hypothetical protein
VTQLEMQTRKLNKRIVLSLVAFVMSAVIMIVYVYQATDANRKARQIETGLAACHEGETSQVASRDAQIYAMVLRTMFWEHSEDIEYFREDPFASTTQPHWDGVIYIYDRAGSRGNGFPGVETTDNSPLIAEVTQCELVALVADLPWEVIWSDDRAEMGATNRDLTLVFSTITLQSNGTLSLQLDDHCFMCGRGYRYIIEEVESGWHIKEMELLWLS